MSNTTAGLVVIGLGILILIGSAFTSKEFTDKYITAGTGLTSGGIGLIGTSAKRD